jgi:hypothetical protein
MKRTLNILFTLLFCWAATVHAHRFHAGITDISFNEKTGSTEIVHTYMTHDVEALLSNLYQRQFDLSDPDDEAILRKYVEKQFYVLAQDKARLPVRWVGLSIDTQGVVIYQEITDTPLSRTSAIHDGVLIDFLPDQVNTINLKRGGEIRSFTFDRDHLQQGVQ